MPRDIALSLVLDPAADGPAQVVEQARLAEQGLFDAVLASPTPRTGLEPTTLLANIAASTHSIGVVASVSAQYTAPFNQARYISTLDHLSKGRAGWNLILPEQDTAPELHGVSATRSDSEKYSRANEYTTVLKKLWDSWDDDVVVADKVSGLYARRESIHPVDHRGEHFAVAGPFNLPRSPQWRPPLYVSVESGESAQFASRHADVAILGADTPVPYEVPSLREYTVGAGEVDALTTRLIEHQDRDGVDGFVLHATIGVVRTIVEIVVPQLQSAGRYRTEYAGSTLAARLRTEVGATL